MAEVGSRLLPNAQRRSISRHYHRRQNGLFRQIARGKPVGPPEQRYVNTPNVGSCGNRTSAGTSIQERRIRRSLVARRRDDAKCHLRSKNRTRATDRLRNCSRSLAAGKIATRSEEHTSELQSRQYLV